MNGQTDLETMARDVIDTNRYLTLGTTEEDHRPRLSPVYFTHWGYRDFYWVSSPQARHSRNIAARPDIAIVIFDSTAEIGEGRAVYLTGTATVVADEDLARRSAEAFARVDARANRFEPHELRGDAALRLYCAHAERHEVHIRGRDPVYGRGLDTRRGVHL